MGNSSSSSCHDDSSKNSEVTTNIYNTPLNSKNAFLDNNICDIIKENKEEKPYICNSDINNKEELKALEIHYNDIKLKNKQFYDDIEEKKEYIKNYKAFLAELNHQINNLKEHLDIALSSQKFGDNLFSKEESTELLNDIENISNKINEMELFIEKQKIELKNLENNFKIIQEQFNEIKKDEQNSPNNKNFMFSTDIDSILEQIFQSIDIIKKLKENKMFYDQKKKEIENEINKIQDKTGKKVSLIKKRQLNDSKHLHLLKINNDIFKEMNDSLFAKGSMLLGIKDFKTAEKMLKSMYIFKKDEDENEVYEKQRLIKKNWHEICYIYDDYDVHDLNYELKAIGLQNNMFFTSSFFEFPSDSNIKIILFKIDGKIADYEYDKYKYSIRFTIHLKKFESNNIHIIYQESPSYDKMTPNQKEIRSIYRRKSYGISHRLVGQKAKYILINSSNFEIINFEDEFFIKNGTFQYEWGGKVPENGKETIVRLSKKEAHISFIEKYVIKTLDNSFIKNSSIKITYCYNGGNNTLIKSSSYSMQTEKIKLNQNKKVFEVQYIDTNSPIGEFIFKGELINRCKGEWKINLTDEEIENLVPPDYKTNKEEFKIIALEIIKEYDAGHSDDIVIVPKVAKIGKWVHKNIKYDTSYKGLNDITAKETYESRRGVCHHITKLFNALMYSLGYQVIYILGYAIDITKSFSINDSHAWSLIKINGKWLPFDATNGIFSGKLPVTYIFKQIGIEGIEPIICYDKVKFEQIEVHGNFIS